MTVYVGTSGWDYRDWASAFYPEDLDERGYLEYAAEAFSSLEVNTSFYRLPDKATLRRWRDTTPDGFVFSVKASRYITHMKKLREAGEALEHHGAAVCVYDLDGRRSPTRRTADFVYMRLHGPDGPYKGRYTRSELAAYAGAIHSWARTGSDVYCYLDNDEQGYAAINAGELSEMVTRMPSICMNAEARGTGR